MEMMRVTENYCNSEQQLLLILPAIEHVILLSISIYDNEKKINFIDLFK